MKKRGIIISLLFLITLFGFGLVIACPVGQIPNFDGTCIGDPNYNAGAVSCAELMASSGKSAETLCNENAAGQCCSQDNSNTNSDYTYTPEDCSGNQIIPGSCEIFNQYMEVENKIWNIMKDTGYSEEAQKIEQAMYDDINNYYTTVFSPAEAQNSKNFDQCLENYKNPNYNGPNCYDDLWKPQYDKEIIAEYNYELQRAQQAYNEITGLSPKKTDNKKTNNKNSGSGSFNTNDNRGRDEFGGMNPSIGGYLGDAYVVRADGTKVIPGHELYLKVDDSIVSGQKSNVNIIFSNAGSINLGPNTVMRVGSALQDQFYLAKGTFKSKIKLQGIQKFEIDTPNANIFVRGTEYVVDYNKTTNTTIIYLNEGVLEIKTKGKIGNLTAGNYLIIYSNGTTWTNQMNSVSWKDLGNNFLEEPAGFDKVYDYVVAGILIFEIIAMIIFAFYINKKIKNIKDSKKKDKSTKKGVKGFVLGILGLLFFAAPYIGLVLSMFSIYFARIQRANNPTKLAMVGLILGIISILLNLGVSWYLIMKAFF